MLYDDKSQEKKIIKQRREREIDGLGREVREREKDCVILERRSV